MIKKTNLLFTLLITLNLCAQNQIISQGENWSYKDNGSDQGTSWQAVGFDDSSWQSGPAVLGYGDSQETIVSYGPDDEDKYPTTYFRKTFNATGVNAFSSIKLEAIRDDGMVVYLNGVQVWSDNMPNTFNYLTYADGTVGSDDEEDWIFKDITNTLVEGTNVIAVEIHQANEDSSDISFDFRITPNLPIPAEIIRGPYLQSGSANSVTIKWRTEDETDSRVNYGTVLGQLNMTVSNFNLTENHEVVLTGLSAGTKYYYEIENEASVYVPQNSNMYIKTSPNIGDKEFVRAWILGDAGTANNNQRAVRDQYYNYVSNTTDYPDQTDLMLFLGDNAYNDGTDNQYQAAFFDIYDEMLKKSVSWSTLGNHDGYSAQSNTQTGPYYNIFTFPTAAEAGGLASGTEAYYSFDYGNIHFIVLESYKLSDDFTQMQWCQQDIQATTQDWIVALFHHPAYTKGSHNSDTESELIEMRENFLPILEDGGVDLVLSGHSHSYERSYFINGHYQDSDDFDIENNTVGYNGDLSGQANTNDGAYVKNYTDTEGAVYITAGSSGKISGGGSLQHEAMFASIRELGSCILEVEEVSGNQQNLNVKFLNNEGNINDHFTINKTLDSTLSNLENTLNNQEISVYPVPSRNVLNVNLPSGDQLKNIKMYNVTGQLILQSDKLKINVRNLAVGTYMMAIKTDKNQVYKTVVID